IGGTEFLVQRISEELVTQFADDVTVFTTDCYNGEAFFLPARRMPVGREELNGVHIRRFHVEHRLSHVARYPQAPLFQLRLPLNQYAGAIASGPMVPGLRRAIRDQPADVIVASSFPLLHMFDALSAARASSRPCVMYGGLHPDDVWGFHRSMIYRAIKKAYYV